MLFWSILSPSFTEVPKIAHTKVLSVTIIVFYNDIGQDIFSATVLGKRKFLLRSLSISPMLLATTEICIVLCSLDNLYCTEFSSQPLTGYLKKADQFASAEINCLSLHFNVFVFFGSFCEFLSRSWRRIKFVFVQLWYLEIISSINHFMLVYY